MNVFLTGGTGFIGKKLVRALAARGWRITALVRDPYSEDARMIQAMGAHLAAGDIGNRSTLPALIKGADAVIHNAGWYELGLARRAQIEMKTVNVQGAENVLGIAASQGVSRIVHISSILAHGRTGPADEDESYQSKQPPLTVYEETKALAHKVAVRLQQQGAPLVIASPAGVIGPGDHSTLGYLSRLYVRGRFIPMMSLGSRATVHVEDCAEGIVLAAEKGRAGEEYLLSGGSITALDMIEVWKSTKGGPKFAIPLPRWMAFSNAMLEPVQRVLGLPNVYSREVFLTGSSCYCYTGAKAERELGASFRDPRQAWLDTLEGERRRLAAGISWRDLSREVAEAL